MHTPANESLGRLPWVLFAVALVFVGALFAISRRSAHAAGNTVIVKRVTTLPAWKPGPNWASAVPPQRVPGEAIRIPIYPPWTEEQATQLFVPNLFDRVDEYCGKLYKPNVRFMASFPEYPGGKIEFVVNSRSMREDDEPLNEKPLLRVLVAGDSHTDGVCKNSESFPNLAESALRRQAKAESAERGQVFDPKSIEVLNAGKGSHSFFNYLGVLERHLDLLPDVFVVTVYGGNDFDEVLSAWHFYRNAGQRPPGATAYPEEVKEAVAIHPPAMNQALSSVKYFDVHPDQMQVALDAGVEVCGQIQALCRERGIRLIVLYLPPRHEVERDSPDMSIRKLLRALKLQPAALATTTQLGDQLLARLLELRIETVDLRPSFQQAGQQLYWSSDWHLNLAGHQLAARALVKALSGRH